MTTSEVQILLDVILILIVLYLALFKSYFSEKGKNIATKEDIHEITEKVETVKNQIYFNTQSQHSLKTEERNSLISYYERYCFWLNCIMDTNLGGINEDNKSRLKEFVERMKNACFDFDMAEGKVRLFVSNQGLIKLANETKLKTLKLQHSTERAMDKLYMVLLKTEHMRKITPIEQQAKEQERHFEKRSQVLDDFRAERLNQYKELLEHSYSFQAAVSSHIKTLVE